MIQQYNPYATQSMASPQPGGLPSQNPAQNPFMNQQNEPKTFSIPTWLFWVVIVGFLGFCGWLIWYLYF